MIDKNNKIKIGGIISEYNPFHNGHKYHIEEFKRQYGITHLVVALSGNFVQRGGPALIDKYCRAEMAINGGADLVVEIPAFFSTQTAQLYARGSVLLLDSLGCVQYMSFGSESGDIEIIKRISETISKNNEEINQSIVDYITQGNSYAVAREKSISDMMENIDSDLLRKSNNILAIEYVNELTRIGSSIIPTTVKRIGSEHKSGHIEGSISSATSIRNIIEKENDFLNIEKYVPAFTKRVIKEYINTGYVFLTEEDFFDSLCIDVLKKYDKLDSFFEVKNGLENSIYKKTPISESFKSLEETLSSPMITRNRIRRALFNILLDVYAVDVEKVKSIKNLPYVRVLGFNEKGRDILRIINEKSDSQVVFGPAKSIKSEEYNKNEIYRLLMNFDIKSSSIYYQKACGKNRTLLNKGLIDFVSLKTLL